MSDLLSGAALRFLSGLAGDYEDRPIRFRQDLEAMIRQDRLGDALALLLAQQLRVLRIGGRDGTLDAAQLWDPQGFRPLLGQSPGGAVPCAGSPGQGPDPRAAPDGPSPPQDPWD